MKNVHILIQYVHPQKSPVLYGLLFENLLRNNHDNSNVDAYSLVAYIDFADKNYFD